MVEQLVDFLAPLDFRVAEQVIEVPKIVCPHHAARTVVGAPQDGGTAGGSAYDRVSHRGHQAPCRAAPLTFQSALGLVLVDVLQDFLPGHFSSSSVEQMVDISVPHRGILGGFQGFHPGQSKAASSEQLVDIPVSHVACISKILISHRFLMKLLVKRFKGFFSHFSPAQESATLVRTRGRN